MIMNTLQKTQEQLDEQVKLRKEFQQSHSQYSLGQERTTPSSNA